MESLTIWDYGIIVGYLLLMLSIGLFYRKTGSNNIEAFFISGKNFPWWLAGVSLIATTFAADTPLAITELVNNKGGIAGNWMWWNFLAGGMLTTFFFSKLWYRADLVTDLELIELRYSGKGAAFLRGFRSIYLGIFMNALVIGWVNIALVAILQVFFDLTTQEALLYSAGAMVFTVLYSSLASALGLAVTDFIQFFVAMITTVALMLYVLDAPEVGGIDGLKAKLPDSALGFFPNLQDLSSGGIVGTAKTVALSVGSFLAYIGVMWWASWYPGNDPGGGGYVAQRIRRTKNQQHAIAATLFFQVVNYCFRPWPWIIVGLSAIILYPQLGVDDKKLGYVMAMRDYLPNGLKGLLITAFFIAYMNTVSSQLNWGTSYLVHDLYKRFINPNATPKQIGRVTRLSFAVIMIAALAVSPFITSIEKVWFLVLECGAGLGLVLILRWYWWRLNAWAELTAVIVPLIMYFVSNYVVGWEFPNSFFLTVGVTTICWISVMYLTKPTNMEVLQKFYNKVKPDGAWDPVQRSLNISERSENIGPLLLCWISSVTMTYGILFLIGYLIFKQWNDAFVMTSMISGSFVILAYNSRKIKIFANKD